MVVGIKLFWLLANRTIELDQYCHLFIHNARIIKAVGIIMFNIIVRKNSQNMGSCIVPGLKPLAIKMSN